jgi:hypothetical protein
MKISGCSAIGSSSHTDQNAGTNGESEPKDVRGSRGIIEDPQKLRFQRTAMRCALQPFPFSSQNNKVTENDFRALGLNRNPKLT